MLVSVWVINKIWWKIRRISNFRFPTIERVKSMLSCFTVSRRTVVEFCNENGAMWGDNGPEVQNSRKGRKPGFLCRPFLMGYSSERLEISFLFRMVDRAPVCLLAEPVSLLVPQVIFLCSFCSGKQSAASWLSYLHNLQLGILKSSLTTLPSPPLDCEESSTKKETHFAMLLFLVFPQNIFLWGSWAAFSGLLHGFLS